MTRAQNMIVNYINQQFVPGSVTIIPVGEPYLHSQYFRGHYRCRYKQDHCRSKGCSYIKCSFSGTKEMG